MFIYIYQDITKSGETQPNSQNIPIVTTCVCLKNQLISEQHSCTIPRP